MVWPAIDAINVAFQIGLPRCRDKLREIANGFTWFSGSELCGCMSAIDGWVCITRKPNQAEVGDVIDEEEQHFLTTCPTGNQHHDNLQALLEEKGLCRHKYNINLRA
jgi:hypothetical protein